MTQQASDGIIPDEQEEAKLTEGDLAVLDAGTPVDLDEFFDTLGRQKHLVTSRDFYVGPDYVYGRHGHKKINRLYLYTKCPAEEDAVCMLDTSMFGDCRTGFVMTYKGIYMADDEKEQKKGFMSWEEFGQTKIFRPWDVMGEFYIGSYRFITNTSDLDEFLPGLRRLQVLVAANGVAEPEED